MSDQETEMPDVGADAPAKKTTLPAGDRIVADVPAPATNRLTMDQVYDENGKPNLDLVSTIPLIECRSRFHVEAIWLYHICAWSLCILRLALGVSLAACSDVIMACSPPLTKSAFSSNDWCVGLHRACI